MNYAVQGVRCYDIHTKFHKDLFRHSKVNGVIQRHKHTERKVMSYKFTFIFSK
jgi:hypothetical protein